MRVWAAFLGCVEPQDREVTFTGSYPAEPTDTAETWAWSDPGAWAPWTCPADRDEDWADWPGGRQMWLDAGTAVVGEPLIISVTGATPGDLIEFRRGNICRLDCPPELDGGCFHPARSNLLGLAVAGNDGVAFIEIPVAIGWSGAWWVVQARAIDSDVPYVSQPLLAHTEDWSGPFPVQLPHREVSDLSIRELTGVFEAVWPVVPGRQGSAWTNAELSGTPFLATSGSLGGYGLGSGQPFLFTEPATVTVRITPTGEIPYDVDLAAGPTSAPIAWHADGDGDGWGGSGEATWSADPIAGRAPNALDCDDGDPDRAPGAPEVCDDGIDQDCDGGDRACSSDGTRVVGAAGLPEPAPAELWLGSGDLSGDGSPDLVIAPLGVVSPLGRVDVDLGADSLLPPGTWMGAVAALADVDGDGADDLINDRNGALQILLGPLSSGGSWDPLAAISHGSWVDAPVRWVEAADLDGDGRAELIVPAGALAYWLPDPLVDPEPALELPVGSARPHAADLDGDGVEDLVTGDGCARMAPFPDPLIDCLKTSDSVGPSPEFASFSSGDADGDGRVDLVAAVVNGPAYVVVSAPPWVEGSAENAAWLAVAGTDPIVSLAASPGRLAGVSDDQVLLRSWVLAPDLGGGIVDLESEAEWLYESVGPSAVLAGDLDQDGADDLAVSVTGLAWADRADPGIVWISWGP